MVTTCYKTRIDRILSVIIPVSFRLLCYFHNEKKTTCALFVLKRTDKAFLTSEIIFIGMSTEKIGNVKLKKKNSVPKILCHLVNARRVQQELQICLLGCTAE
jgi:hypothetical protein